MKKLPVTQLLNKIYGGQWKNIPFQNMWIDQSDENRMVFASMSCSCDDICNHLPNYHLYGNGPTEHLCFGNYLQETLQRQYENMEK